MKNPQELWEEARLNREEIAREVARFHLVASAQRPKARAAHRWSASVLAVALVVVIVVVTATVIALTWKAPAARGAGSIVVTSTADILANDGRCTLREAVIAANKDAASGTLPGECPAGSGADTIVLQAGATYMLALHGNDDVEPNATEGDLDISADLKIQVPNGETATIDGNGAATADRVIDIAAADVTLTGVTIRGGNLTQGGANGLGGGGIRVSSGDLTLVNSAVNANSAPNGVGGGIHFAGSGTLTITNSVISGNTAMGGGGFIAEDNGRVTITGSTIADNTATQVGGAFTLGESALTLENSTISGNRSPRIPGIGLLGTAQYLITGSSITGNSGGGGAVNTFPDTGGSGIFNTGRLKVINSTISGNRGPANQPGVAIDNAGGTLTLANVTIADNTSGIRRLLGTVTIRNSSVAASAGALNCAGGLTEPAGAGYNLDSGNTCGFAPDNHSLPNTEP